MDVRQISNQRKYDLAASSYGFIAYLMSLGQADRLYDELADCINLPPDATIAELGCGPASVILGAVLNHLSHMTVETRASIAL
jgi:ubiquinone/menaquinone biosynthesis C-methylase UbiE